MAERVRVELIDDIDGSEATQRAAFGWMGKEYQIDLNDKNFAQLEKALTKFVENARTVKNGKVQRQVPTGPDPKAVRAWATANGIEVNRLGKVPQEIIDQYRAAGN